MLNSENNEILTRVGPGSAMGGLFRHFWQPALLSEEIPAPDCPPVRVRLMGEDFVAFRDSNGDVGLLDAHCPHRLADLFFGRNEEGGLRCVYHGWKFSVTGEVLDIPSEPADSRMRCNPNLRANAYPVHEAGGMVWVYLGPKESIPPLPEMEFMGLPAEHVYASKCLMKCNYQQALEGKLDGTAVAVHDRCPHRFAPLHLGKRDGDDVACVYHGLRFNAEGQCTHNPHGDGRIPKAAQLRSFPLLERHGFLWIWMGDEPADPSRLPDFSPLDEGHPNALAYTYMPMKANYELIIDNVMDLSHIDHVHGEIISTRGQLSPLVPKTRESKRAISARWEWQQTPAMLIFADFLPEPKASARHFFDITWSSPANIQLSVGANQDSGPLDLQNTVGQYDLHTCTPETENTSHYWFATRRNHVVEDGEYNKMKIQAMHGAFVNEDGPIIEAVDAEMGTPDFFSLNPVLMTNDVAAVKVRRLLRQLLASEQGKA